jgi:hypothetical protein
VTTSRFTTISHRQCIQSTRVGSTLRSVPQVRRRHFSSVAFIRLVSYISTSGVRPTPSVLMAFAQGCALSVLCKVRVSLRVCIFHYSTDVVGAQDHIVAHASAAALSLTWISSSKRLHESVARRPLTSSQAVAGAFALPESLLNTHDLVADTHRPKTSYTVIKPGSPAQVRHCQMQLEPLFPLLESSSSASSTYPSTGTSSSCKHLVSHRRSAVARVDVDWICCPFIG